MFGFKIELMIQIKNKVIGLILDILGSILIALSIGKIPCTSSSTCGGITYKMAYIIHPDFLKFGLIILIVGFIFQLFEKDIKKKNQEKGIYACLIHPMIRQNKPGECSNCKRRLELKKRNWVEMMELSLGDAKKFLKGLCDIDSKLSLIDNNLELDSKINNEEYNHLTLLRRAFRISLIIEIGRLFDTYDKKPTISFGQIKYFKQNRIFKKEIDSIRGEVIISKIIETRNNYIAHISEIYSDVVSNSNICNSKLEGLLDRLDKILKEFKIDKEK